MCCSSISNATNSPLLRLPGEIRNEIFAYVYTEAVYELELEAKGWYTEFRVVLSGPEKYLRKCEVHLSLVCRQVQTETAMLPYKLGEFSFKATNWRYHEAVVGMRSFLERRSPRQLHALGKVTLWRTKVHPRPYWIQTRTATYWLAKFGEDVLASDNTQFCGVPLHFDIADFGPSDSKRT